MRFLLLLSLLSINCFSSGLCTIKGQVGKKRTYVFCIDQKEGAPSFVNEYIEIVLNEKINGLGYKIENVISLPNPGLSDDASVLYTLTKQ